MDFEKYTDRARGFIQSAQNLALREGHQRFTPEHILKVLLVYILCHLCCTMDKPMKP